MRKLFLALLVMPALAVSAAAIAKPHKAARHAATKPAVVKPAAPQLEAHVLPAASPDLLPDMSLGNPNAPVTVIEYASAACPHCAHWNAEVWPQFQAKYVTTGKVRYIFREVLTNPQEYAVSAFLVGRCAVKRAKDPTSSAPYFAVVDSYFRNQQAYFTDHNIGAATAEVKAKTGMTPADITACIGDGPSFDAFMKNMKAHTEADHVNSTPTFFVNGQRLDGHDMADLDAAIAAVK